MEELVRDHGGGVLAGCPVINNVVPAGTTNVSERGGVILVGS